MSKSRFLKVTDQVMDFLRDGIRAGRWRGSLPGRDQMARELGVSHTTMEAAMRRLATEGLLASQGAGRRRRIVLPVRRMVPGHFRIRILLYESVDRGLQHIHDLLDRLEAAGFSADFAPKALLDLGMNVNRVARLVQQNPADAWIVAAASREVLAWFCAQPAPAYAMFGVKANLPIAGCGVQKDIRPLIRRLVELGHRRIVLLMRGENVKPQPSLFPRRFLEALKSEGITPGPYNLPMWGQGPEGLRRCLESLHQVSPPTALIAGEAVILLAVRDWLARRGVTAPRDVSLVCLDPDPSFSWCDPLVSHFSWDFNSMNRRIVRWAQGVTHGKDDRRQTVSPSQFVEGGTIGPARE